MPQQITFSVPGNPRGKGRAKSATRIGIDKRTGKTRAFTKHYTPAETEAYESLIRLAAARAMDGRPPYTGPIQVEIHITCPIPASWSQARQRRAAAGEIVPTTKPDGDNVEKAIKDGMNGVVYRDDCQVVDDTKRKRYGLVPCVVVTVTELQDVEPAQGRKRLAVEPASLPGLFAEEVTSV